MTTHLTNGDLPLTGKRFLVVDDEEFSRRILGSILTGLGAGGLSYAADGREAMELLIVNGETIDCIVSDIRMEPINGLQLLKAIRVGLRDLRRDLPLVLVSGHPDAEVSVVQTARALDVSGFALKPVSAVTMLARVKRALENPFKLKSPDQYRGVEL